MIEVKSDNDNFAIITDQHFGVRNDSELFLNHQKEFYEDVFFPELEKRNIKDIFMLGDTFDRRKYINYKSFDMCKRFFFDELQKRDIKVHGMIVGNHDIYYKNTNKVNAPELLVGDRYNNINIINEPTEVSYNGLKILLLPWISPDNYERCIEAMNNTKAQILFGHLELIGFEMYRGAVNKDHGHKIDLFSKFDIVCTGHFHHKSSYDNIHYLGAPYEMTWSDYNDPRGFHIFNARAREMEYIKSPLKMFYKVFYDDVDTTLNDLIDQDFSLYKGKCVKVIIKNKENPYWFDTFMSKLEEVNPASLQTVEDNLNLQLDDDEDLMSEAEDTPTLMNKFIDNYNNDLPKQVIKDVKSLARSLYEESLSID